MWSNGEVEARERGVTPRQNAGARFALKWNASLAVERAAKERET